MPNYRRNDYGPAYDQFETLGLFEKPDRSRRERLARQLSLKRWNAGEVIYEAGDEPTHMYWVVEGKVEESVLHEGKLWLRRNLGVNKYFGQQGFFWGRYQSQAKASNNVELLCVTPAGLREILEELPKFRERLIPEKRAQQLRKLPLFRSLTDTEIRWLALVTRTVSLASEHTFDLKKKPGLWTLGWGRVSIECGDGSLPEGRLTAGGFFLSSDVKISSPRKTKIAQTILQSRLYRLPSAYVKNMVEAFPDMQELLAKPRNVPETLQGIELFDGEGMTGEHRNHLAQFFGWEFIPVNQNITIQGSVGRSFVIVNDGKALVTGRDDQGRERPINILRAVQGFGNTSLLEGASRDVSVRAMKSNDRNRRTLLEGAECLILDRRDLQFAFAECPELWHEGVSLFDSFKERATKKQRYDWLEEGEDLRWHNRRHWLWLAVPLLIYVLVALPLLLLVVNAPDVMRLGLLLVWVLIFVPVGTLIVVNYYDDYYAVTNQRVVRRDRIVLLYRARVEAPLEMVQDVTMQQGLIGSLFDYADINIRTAAKEGSIRFDSVPKPDELRSLVFRQRTESKAAEQGYQREVMRRNLMTELHLVLTISKRKRALGDSAGSPPVSGWWRQLVHRLTPSRQPQSNPAKEAPKYGPGEIVWRKHPLNLIVRAGPSLVVLLLVIFSLPLFLNLGSADPFRIFVVWLGLLFLVLFWVAFEAADYFNDLYVVTDDVIIDIEATPLRLSTQRRQGGLDRVQTVYLNQKGLIANLLNFGNVIIQTAAVNEGFTFEFVYNPKQVQNQVFQKLQAYRRRQQQLDLKQAQRQLLQGLDVYHDITDSTD